MSNQKFKPMLFSTDMVRALLDNRKTATRRAVKFPAGYNPKWTGYIPDGPVLYGSNNIPAVKSPYRLGDILYIRETWQIGFDGTYLYKADIDYDHFMTPEEEYFFLGIPWRPSIHMPREAARLFLRVMDVRVERLQDITPKQLRAEGVRLPVAISEGQNIFNRIAREREEFANLWSRTIKPADRALYGWETNPWVWVISFERIAKEEI